MLHLYNTLTRTKEAFVPPAKGPIRMFVCGPTVYNHIHIGNARTYIFFDFFASFLRTLGHELEYLQNITDVDDKIIARADLESKSPEEIAREYEQAYHEIEAKLHLDGVSRYARASDHIKEVLDQITRLIEKAHAYESNGSVYFSVESFPRFGALSRQNLAELEKAERTEENPDKRNSHDFVLWKAYREGEPFWDSPWGKGRPGWHIEDTAITERYFGPQYDIHGGGLDIIFPHHEAEIAQQESATTLSPFVRFWMHSGLLTVKGEKMSKSLGNFTTAKELLDQHPTDVVRFAMLSAHYRSPLDFSDSLFNQAKESRGRIKELLERLEGYHHPEEPSELFAPKARKEFDAALEDDLNTPAAIAVLFSLVREIHKKIDANAPIDQSALVGFFMYVESLFKIGLFEREEVPSEIRELALLRETAKKAKDFETADKIRGEIRAKGYEISDTKAGHTLRKVA
ncbi:MAG: cysteine--tRNA ligase [Patescibacteria group bacterium]